MACLLASNSSRCDASHRDAMVSKQCTMVVARYVLTGEVKYFAKEELGWDHFECRSWVSIDRHLFAVILGQLFRSRVRQKLNVGRDVLGGDWLTM